MLKNSLVLLSLTLTAAGLAVGQEKKVNAAKNGVINVFPNCEAVPGNLVRNCGFETGTFDFWRQSGDTSFTMVTTDAAHSGSFGARIGPVSGPGFLSQTLPTIPGQLYDVSFWMRNAGRPNQFLLYWDGMPISSCISFPETASPGLNAAAYDQFDFAGLPASSDGTVLTFGFFNRNDFFFFDDVVVLPSPSAATAN